MTGGNRKNARDVTATSVAGADLADRLLMCLSQEKIRSDIAFHRRLAGNVMTGLPFTVTGEGGKTAAINEVMSNARIRIT